MGHWNLRNTLRRWAVILLLLAFSAGALPVFALQKKLPLKEFDIREDIYLPTVRSQRVVEFTVPKTWNVNAGSHVHLVFQHSNQLQPHRSWLDVVVNDNTIKHIPLTHQNAEATTMNIPIPVGLLSEKNTLIFRVEQHYTDKCEDPLDQSLWTQVLQSTDVVFEYSEKLPKVALDQYPFPIIDPLAYTPAQVRYEMGGVPGDDELKALTLLNIHLARNARDNMLQTQVGTEKTPYQGKEHLIIVGTPSSNALLKSFGSNNTSFQIKGGQWVNSANSSPLSGNEGVVFFTRHPDFPKRTVTIVSGNSPKGVLKAAQYLTSYDRPSDLMGQAVRVSGNWQPSFKSSSAKTPYVGKETRTVKDLGHDFQRVEKINAPPINYYVPVVADFSDPKNKLAFEVYYSYSEKLNPLFSSLEIRMNDRPIANIPLLKENGEIQAKKTIPIPNDLIRNHNHVVAQFHMLPDKYGWCVDNFVDESWGEIHANSRFIVSGNPPLKLSDISLFQLVGYPFTEKLKDVHVALADPGNASYLKALLGVTTRLGQTVLKDEPLDLSVKGKLADAGGKHTILIGTKEKPGGLASIFNLHWPTADTKKFTQLDNSTIQIVDTGKSAYLEQKLKSNNAVLWLTAQDDHHYEKLQRILEEKPIEMPPSGSLKQFTSTQGSSATIDNPELILSVEEVEASWWESIGSNFWVPIFIVVILLFIVVIILPVFFRPKKRRR